MNVLVTGGLGYIGSHVVVELLVAGHEVTVVDNLGNCDLSVKMGIEKASGGKSFTFYDVDICDRGALDVVFCMDKIDCVVHFAALKAVGLSVSQPLEYYGNNVGGMVSLLQVMQRHNVHKLVFSSSATVYGTPKSVPIYEDFEIQAINPYGHTKVMAEQIIRDYAIANPEFCAASLRYFNPVGAHSSRCIGESPKGIPNNLMPLVCKVASGEMAQLKVFGDDYDTVDGTCVRDYVHVVDLSIGHLRAVDYVMGHKGVESFNLGTGNGTTVLQLIKEFENVNNVKVPYEIVGRREGDTTTLIAGVQKAKDMLKWEAKLGVAEMCKDHFEYARKKA